MKLLTEQDKKNLRTFSRYLKSYGQRQAYITYESDYEEIDLSEEIPLQKDYFDYPRNVEIPEFLVPIINKVLDFSKDKLEIDFDVDTSVYLTFDLKIDVVDKTITAEKTWNYEAPGDTNGTTWDEENDSESIKEVFDSLKEDNLPNELHLDYNGGGDSGYIEAQFQTGEPVPRLVEDWCYRELESLHGGWEINEGSQGYFRFDAVNRIIELEHTFNENVSKYDTIYEESFEKSN
jgi:hypothetical protein